MICTKKQVEESLKMYRNLRKMVDAFENELKELDRHFTLDGHLVGSIGEVVASYHYNIDLSKVSQKTYDGIYMDQKSGETIEVQIKITQQDSIILHDIPKHLIALYLTEDGNVYEIYNGPANIKYIEKQKRDGYKNKHLSIFKLMEENKKDYFKIEAKEPLEPMTKEKRNPKRRKKKHETI